MTSITPIQQASYQQRTLKKIQATVTTMAADWGDIDNYFLSKLESLAHDIAALQTEMKDYVEESKQ